jgi:hypothetical protein
MAERKAADGGRLPKAVGVYDRPRVRRSTRLMIIVGIVVVAIMFVLLVLLR